MPSAAGLPVPDIGFRPTIGASLRRAVEHWGERDFIVMPDRRITFAGMERASRALGKQLLASGVGKGTRVGIFDTYSIEWVVSWLAITRIGALAMPLSSIYRPAEIATVLGIGDVHTLLLPPTLLGRNVPDMLEEAVPGLAATPGKPLLLPELPYLRQIWVWGPIDGTRPWATEIAINTDPDNTNNTDPNNNLSDDLFAAVEEQVVPADWAQVTYTSGSSALPKGVVHSHGTIIRTTAQPIGVVAGLKADQSPPDPGPSVQFCAFPLFWIGGTLSLGRALHSGSTLCCLPRFEPAAALDMIEKERCTSVTAWPSLIQAMRGDPSFAARDLSHIPMLLPGFSSPLMVGPVPGVQGHRSMSELVGNWAGSERRAIDPETGTTLPDMEEGELVVRGYGLMQGYYKKEREEVFDADGWLHTGDRVFLHENRVWFVGRFYEMVKSQGANVAPKEVETVFESWPEIKHVFVFGLPHETLEEEVTALVSFMPGATLSVDEMKRRANAQMSSYKVPTRIEIIDDEATIPWLGSGKPDKLQMRARLLESP